MYFFDSYALIEIIFQNEKYLNFKDKKVITNVLNISEFYYFLLNNYNKQTADFWVRILDIHLIDISKDISINAAIFRYENKSKKLSYADCIGYVTAMKNNMKFLTGDKEFKNFENVEFVQ